jgi:uncharacterized protein (TIGR02145 family)
MKGIVIRMLFLVLSFFSMIAVNAQRKKGGEFVSDIQRNKYPVVLIGDSYWLGKNLTVSAFSNGDDILEVSTPEKWVEACAKGIPAYCYYDFNSANAEMYGAIYNFSAISDARNICPKGYHLPTENEWYALIMNLGGRDVAGTKLKSDNNWGREEEYELANASKMNTPGSAGMNEFGEFYENDLSAYFWSSSVSLSGDPIVFVLNDHSGSIDSMVLTKYGGYSVRAVKLKSSN